LGADEIRHPRDGGIAWDGITFENEMSNWIAEMQNCVLEDNVPLDRAKQLLEKVQWIEVPGSLASPEFSKALTAAKLGRIYGWPLVGVPGESGDDPQQRYALLVYLPQGPRNGSYDSRAYRNYYAGNGNEEQDRLQLRYDMAEELNDMLCGCYPRHHSAFDTVLSGLLDEADEDLGHNVPVMVHSKSYSSHQALNVIHSKGDNERMIMHYSVGPSFGLFEAEAHIADSQAPEMLSASYDCTESLPDDGGTSMCYIPGEQEIGGLAFVKNMCNRDTFIESFGYNSLIGTYVSNIRSTLSPMCIFTSINDGASLYNTGSVYANDNRSIPGWDVVPPLANMDVFEDYLGDAIENINPGGPSTCFRIVAMGGEGTEVTSPAQDCHYYTNSTSLFDAIIWNLTHTGYKSINLIEVFGELPTEIIDFKDEDEPGHLEYWETPTKDGVPLRATLWPSIEWCAKAFDIYDPVVNARTCRACREAEVLTDTDDAFPTGGSMTVSRDDDSMVPRDYQLKYPDDGNLEDYDVIYLGVNFYDDIIAARDLRQFRTHWYNWIAAFNYDDPGQFSRSSRRDSARLANDVRIPGDLRLNDEIKGTYNYFKRVDTGQTLDSFYSFVDFSRAPESPKFLRQNRFFHFDWDVEPLNSAGGLYFEWGCAGAWFKIKTRVYYDEVSDDGAPGYTSRWFDTEEKTVLFMKDLTAQGSNPTKPVPLATAFNYSQTLSASDTDECAHVFPFIPGNATAIGSERYSVLYVYGPGLSMRWLSDSTEIGGCGPWPNPAKGYRCIDRFCWNPNEVYCERYPDSNICPRGSVARPAWTGTLMVVMMNNGEYFVQEYPITLDPGL
jgi:hypothetical protein